MIITNFPDYPTTTATLSFANEGAGDNDGSMYTHVVHLAAVISMGKSMRDPDKYKRVNYGGSRKVFDWIRKYNNAVLSSSTKGVGLGMEGEGEEVRHPARVIRKVVAVSSTAIYGDLDPHLFVGMFDCLVARHSALQM